MLYYNDQVVGNIQSVIDITEDAFSLIPSGQRGTSNESLYVFSDSGRTVWNKLKKTADKAGYEGFINGIGGGTLIGALQLAYTRMGYMSFTVNQDNSVSVTYDNTVVPVTPHTKGSNLTGLEENTYWNTVLGNLSTINTLGYNFKSMSEALKYLFMILHKCGFYVNLSLNTVTIADYSDPQS